MSKQRKSVRARKSAKPRKTAAAQRLQSPENLRRREVLMIAAVLANLPALDRATENAESHPYNSIASSDAMQELVEKLVRQRSPQNAWNAVHGSMCKTDQSGEGYWAWMDAFRDASFQCGVEYAFRSLPESTALLGSLPDEMRRGIGVIMAATAREMRRKDGQ